MTITDPISIQKPRASYIAASSASGVLVPECVNAAGSVVGLPLEAIEVVLPTRDADMLARALVLTAEAVPAVLVRVAKEGVPDELTFPSSLAGIAGPTPLLVQGVGTGKVEVFGSASVSPW